MKENFFESSLAAKEFIEARYSKTGQSTTSPANYGTNRKMDSEVYKLRRIVMEYVYEAKKLLKGKMDRVEVRVVKLSPEKIRNKTAGYAYLGDHIIWISDQMLTDKKYAGFERELVFHELLHANYGITHNSINKLMTPSMGKVPMSKEQADKDFLEQIKEKK